MDERSLGPRQNAGACRHQSLHGPVGQEPSLSSGITSRLAGIRGGPQGAVSDVGDPTERLTSFTALRLPNGTTLYGSRPDPAPLRESPLTGSIVSPVPVRLLAFGEPPGGSRSTVGGRVPGGCDLPAPAPLAPRASAPSGRGKRCRGRPESLSIRVNIIIVMIKRMFRFN